MLLSLSACSCSRKGISVVTPGTESLKNVTFMFANQADATYRVDMERLAGFTTVLEHEDKRYVSSPIEVKKNRGSCTIRDVPPGDYELRIEILRLAIQMTVPVLPAREIRYEVEIGGFIVIRLTNQ
jgi:hypothetical protein